MFVNIGFHVFTRPGIRGGSAQVGCFSRAKDAGFALVVALSLTALMLLAVMSLSAFTLVETQNAVQRERQAVATQNAVLGLQLALGELQRSAGLDQRVTARADIVDANSPNPEWTGVWPTFDPDYVPATTTTQLWELERFRNWSLNTIGPRWLVSSSQGLGATLNPTLPADDPANNPPIPGYAGSPLQAMARRSDGSAVMAGRIPLREDRSGQALSGMTAWWVADEGVKARVFNTLEHEGDAHDWYETQVRSASPPPLDGSRTAMLDSTALAAATGSATRPQDISLQIWERIGSVSDLFAALDATEPSEPFKAAFDPDFTFFSSGVLSDVRRGGLKKDLTRGLDDQFPTTLSGRPVFWRGVPPTPPQLSSTNILFGGLWEQLYDFYNLYRPYQPFWMEIQRPEGGLSRIVYRPNNNPGNPLGPVGLGAYNSRPASDPAAALKTRTFGPRQQWGVVGLPADRNFDLRFDGNDTDFGGGGGAWEDGGMVRASQYVSALEDPVVAASQAGFTAVWNPVAPVVLRTFFGISPITYDLRGSFAPPLTPAQLAAIEERPYQLVFAVRPGIVVWNPYNVPLAVNHMASFHQLNTRLTIVVRNTEGSSRILQRADSTDPIVLRDLIKTRYYFLLRGDQSDPHALPILQPGEIQTFYLLNTMASGNQDALNAVSAVPYSPDAAILTSLDLTGVRRPDMDLLLAEDEYVERVTVHHDIYGHTNIHRQSLYEKTLGFVRGPLSQTDPGLNIYPGGFDNANRMYLVKNRLAGPRLDLSDSNPSVYVLPYTIRADHMVIPRDAWGRPNFTNPESIPLLPGNLLPEPFAYFVTEHLDMNHAEGTPLFSQMNIFRTHNSRLPGGRWWATPLERSEWRSSSFYPTSPAFEVWSGRDEYNPLIVREIHRQPLQSIGSFMHASLNFADTDAMYPVGSSYASPFTQPDEFGFVSNFGPVVTGGGDNPFYLRPGGPRPYTARYFEKSWLYNDALWDRFFFSTVPSQGTAPAAAGYSPGFNASLYPPFTTFDPSFVEAARALPNPRMRYYRSELLGESTTDYIEALRDFDGAAARLLVEGAFNVNSTSVEAWKAVLSAYQEAVAVAGGSVDGGGGDTRLSRFTVPGGAGSDDYFGARLLSDSELDALAREIVDQVRLRGPFLSMADFVNRRLSNDPVLGYSGALQAALDATVNAASTLGEPVGFTSTSTEGAGYVTVDGVSVIRDNQLVPRQGTGLPGWLLQNDLLKALGPILTVRSDTFVIRSYGEVTDPATGEAIASRWIEAVVQRVPDYADPTNAPEVEPWIFIDGLENDPVNFRPRPLVANATLSAINHRFGRQFQIRSIRLVEP